MVAPVISAKLASAPETACGECLSDEDVLAFASGTLDASRHLEAHDHFDQCEICQRLLSEAAHALATAVTIPDIEAGELSWHTTFQTGTLVGHRYLIRHFIARGGMGEVYEAFDRELQERVALKTVTSTACDNAGAVRRLKAEVQLARRVSHPNVCRIYDFGTHVMPETGAPISFLTMEFVDGETLGQRIRQRGALPIDQARRLGRELLSGLTAAHEAGVLHRDFKSDNVMLRDEPEGGCSPLILDFGLARALDDGSRNHSASTPNLLGTFSYIAPEQLQGQPHTTASDVYSLGLVWFEMLTGELPFDSPASPVGSALARLQGPPAAPSSKNPLVPSDLDTIVLRCLRRSPKDRYKTAREVLQAFDALEARTRTVGLKRRLTPLWPAAILGGAAAYVVATIPPGDRAVAVTIQRSAPAASAPLPAPSSIEPGPATPIQSARVIPLPPATTAERPLSVAPNARSQKPPAPVATTSSESTPKAPPPEPAALASDPLSTNAARIPAWENPFDEPTAVASGGSSP